MTIRKLEVAGADANNLKFVDVAFPSPGVTLISGASGSGKSSLLADTLAAEGGRRNEAFLRTAGYDKAASLATISAMAPMLHVGQRAFRATSRTTVATATGLMLPIRRLFLRYATPVCGPSNEVVPAPTPKAWSEWLLRHAAGSVSVWAVPLRFANTDGRQAVKRLAAAGITEFVLRSETDRGPQADTGRTVLVSKFRELDPRVRHTIEVCVARFKSLGPRDADQLSKALHTAFEAGNGNVIVELPQATDPTLKSEFGPRLDSEIHRLHPDSPSVFRKPDRHLLTFNSPEHFLSGACPACRGTGRATTLNEAALVTDPRRSMHEGAFSLWTPSNYKYVNIQHDTIEGLRGLNAFDPDKPWNKLSSSAKAVVFDGWGEKIRDVDRRKGKPYGDPRPFDGFREAVLKRVAKGSAKTAALLKHLVHEGACPECGGSRWSKPARALRVGSLGLVELLDVAFEELPDLLAAGSAPSQATNLVREITRAAHSISSVGLGHLSASRGMDQVSSGEARRLRLAGALNAPLTDVLVLLDEPARGLHEADIAGLAQAIRTLSARHSVVVSDHRRGLLATADLVIDMGTQGGPDGGTIHKQGAARIAGAPLVSVPAPAPTRPGKPSGNLRVSGASLHSLKDVSVDIPLGQLVCITGVSGSGKSTFVRGILVPGLSSALSADKVDIEDFDLLDGGAFHVEGARSIHGVVALDQKAPPPNRRSLLATFLDIADEVRALFAAQPSAKRLGLVARDFGLNAGNGRCSQCNGIGEVGEGAHAAPCPECGGARFGPSALSIEVDELNPASFFALAIDELLARPRLLPKAFPLLETIRELGLSYLSLGRRVDSLSGGEIQRLRIAKALCTDSRTKTLFVLDEPAAGLHPVDVERLMRALVRMLNDGKNTVVLVEHNPAIIARADHLIEFGPGTGPKGGKVVAEGSPHRVAKTQCPTGLLLRSKHGMPKALALPPRQKSAAPSQESAAIARDWLRVLNGDDVEPPEFDEASPARPGVAQAPLLDRPAMELGALDYEVAALIVDVYQDEVAAQRAQLLKQWTSHPEAHLEVIPGLHEMQVWGREPPKTVQKALEIRVKAQGMEIVTAPRGKRALGSRLQPRDTTERGLLHALEEGLALGAGYVELVQAGAVIAQVEERLVDLSRGLVGPARLKPTHLMRTELGACPMCHGSSQVSSFDERLMISSTKAKPGEDHWLSSSANDILKGIIRSELRPFLTRLAAEGLWDAGAPFQKLPEEHRRWLLHGYWRRPGPGTFLKKGKDPSEVGSWLRWDGLVNHLAEQLPRSKDKDWRQALEASRRSIRCPECAGSGLAATADLIRLGDETLRNLITHGTAATLGSALRKLPRPKGDAARRYDIRLQKVLGVLKVAGKAKLEIGARDLKTNSKILQAMVDNLTTMSVV